MIRRVQGFHPFWLDATRRGQLLSPLFVESCLRRSDLRFFFFADGIARLPQCSMKSFIGCVVNVVSLFPCSQCMNCFGQRRSTGFSDAFVAFLCPSTRCAPENPTQHVATAEQKETKSLLRVLFHSRSNRSAGGLNRIA